MRKNSNGRESYLFDRATIADIQRAANDGIYKIRGFGAKRKVPHFDDLVFRTMIPRSVRLSEAPSFGQSIFEYDPSCAGAYAYCYFAEEFAERFNLLNG